MIVKNDVYDYGLKIYQDTEKFKFSLDSLLLAEFVDIKKSDGKIVDFCSGNAPIPMILSSKYQKKIIGIEIQKEIYKLGIQSIKENNLDNMIEMINANVLEAPKYIESNSVDVITCNPPFFKVNKTTLVSKDADKAQARHEISISLEEIFKIASNLLKSNGKFYLVHRPERLQEIMKYASDNNFAVKEIKFISSYSEDYAIMVLLKFVKNGQIGTKVSTNIINRDTKTYKDIFKK